MANKAKRKISKTSALHIFKLVFRSLLFLGALAIYIYNRLHGGFVIFDGQFRSHNIFLIVIWIIFLVEMLLRFAPNSLESMGCQKIFSKNYKPAHDEWTVKPPKKNGRTIALISWIALNAVIGILYFVGIFDKGILILISLIYSICDMICILFFCPFQTWMMGNKCCGSCHIYNWDFAMMFTPLVFIFNFFTWSLVLISLLLVAQWEITYREHPERFNETTNASLQCANCKEKLCSHKKQLQGFLKKMRKYISIQKNKETQENHSTNL